MRNEQKFRRQSGDAGPAQIPCPGRGAAVRMRQLRNRALGFRDDETGAMLLVGLLMLAGMLVVAGMSIDVLRYESMRTRLQNTLDSATLAAANLDQTGVPQLVVKDYMSKAGLSQFLDNVNVTTGLNTRTVAATASASVPTVFMRLAGIDELSPNVASTASESIGNVEISLVLDVSGSMNDYGKIGNLRAAASNFIARMFNSVESNKLSISVVPYSTQVSLGPELASYYNIQTTQPYSNCVNFQASDFQTTALPTTEPLTQTGNFDPWYYTTNISQNGLWVCPQDPSRAILPFSDDMTKLEAMVGNLQASGNTSIDVGMKWGAALLDPSSQPIVTAMIAKGELPPEFAGRPYEYSNNNALKVLVVMTDGSNTSRPSLNPAYASGLSPVWNNSADSNNFSYYDASRKQYYWTYDNSWHSESYGDKSSYTSCNRSGKKCTTTTYAGKATQMTWPQVWNSMSVNWFGYYIIGYAYGQYAYQQAVANILNWQPAQGNGATTQDSQMLDVCNEAKANHVMIYSIGFMADPAGVNVLKQCATTPSYFFDVKDLNINQAFSSIANSITKLRLTQ